MPKAASSKLERVLAQGNQAWEQERWGTALTMYRKALTLDKNNPRIMLRLAQVLLTTGEPEEARDTLRAAVRRRANHANTVVALAQANLELGDMDGVHAALDKALGIDPRHGAAIHAKIAAFLDTGRADDARAFADALGPDARSSPLARIACSRLDREQGRSGEAADRLRGVIDDPDALERHKRSARFELGMTLDAMGEYDDAFACFERANAGHNPGKTIHPESIKSAWSREALDAIPQADTRDERPVIVSGFPRSGTTLLERVVRAHPDGSSVGELPILLQQVTRLMVSSLDQAKIDQCAGEYAAALSSRGVGGAARVVDKHMGTERTLGLASKVLPDLRVVHALRDPRDCCLSAYFQNFGSNAPYSRSLATLGRQYAAHREMLDYWRGVLGVPFFVSVYEDFVADQERATRALLGFLGLPFDDACLRFHESGDLVRTASSTQVRRPLYTSSTARWTRYEKHIGPLLEELGPYADGVHAAPSWETTP